MVPSGRRRWSALGSFGRMRSRVSRTFAPKGKSFVHSWPRRSPLGFGRASGNRTARCAARRVRSVFRVRFADPVPALGVADWVRSRDLAGGPACRRDGTRLGFGRARGNSLVQFARSISVVTAGNGLRALHAIAHGCRSWSAAGPLRKAQGYPPLSCSSPCRSGQAPHPRRLSVSDFERNIHLERKKEAAKWRLLVSGVRRWHRGRRARGVGDRHQGCAREDRRHLNRWPRDVHHDARGQRLRPPATRCRHRRISGRTAPPHAGPFDRALVALAQRSRRTVLTSDAINGRYCVPMRW